MELTDRKRQILKIVVEEYVAAAEPVGSKAIAQRMPGKISSATIRNELADLTEMGYLEQPHTSAGGSCPRAMATMLRSISSRSPSRTAFPVPG